MDTARLLIVYHSQSGHTQRLAEAVADGARSTGDIQVVMKRAFDADADDLRLCTGLLLGTPENFGYMSGALKDFFDRTYYPCEGQLQGLPYGVFISAGNDGSGAVREIARIARGYGWRPVIEPMIVRGEFGDDAVAAARDLGEGFATALALGMF